MSWISIWLAVLKLNTSSGNIPLSHFTWTLIICIVWWIVSIVWSNGTQVFQKIDHFQAIVICILYSLMEYTILPTLCHYKFPIDNKIPYWHYFIYTDWKLCHLNIVDFSRENCLLTALSSNEIDKMSFLVLLLHCSLAYDCMDKTMVNLAAEFWTCSVHWKPWPRILSLILVKG